MFKATFDEVPCIFFSSLLVFLVSKNPLSNPKSQRFIPTCSSQRFIVVVPTLNVLIHFELSFVWWEVRVHAGGHLVVLAPFVKKTFSPQELSW